MIRLTETTAPTVLPVSLNELKGHIKIDDEHVEDDPLLMGYLRAAVLGIEKYTRRQLMTATYTLWMDDWPNAGAVVDYSEGWSEGALIENKGRAVELPNPPLQSVTHVKTYDDSDAATTWAASNYFVDTVSEPGRVVARVGQAFPVPTRTALGVEIQYVAGYGGEPHKVPEGLRFAIMHWVKAMYDNECDMAKAGSSPIPMAAAGQANPYRLQRVA